MSELKAYGIRGIDGLVVESESGQLYLKSEADNVITDLKEKYKTEVKELLCLIRDKENNFNRAFDSEEKEIRHHKYKRCLAKANALTWEHNYLVDFVSSDFPNIRFKRKHKLKWMNKWLELAEKFKEGK